MLRLEIQTKFDVCLFQNLLSTPRGRAKIPLMNLALLPLLKPLLALGKSHAARALSVPRIRHPGPVPTLGGAPAKQHDSADAGCWMCDPTNTNCEHYRGTCKDSTDESWAPVFEPCRRSGGRMASKLWRWRASGILPTAADVETHAEILLMNCGLRPRAFSMSSL